MPVLLDGCYFVSGFAPQAGHQYETEGAKKPNIYLDTEVFGLHF